MNIVSDSIFGISYHDNTKEIKRKVILLAEEIDRKEKEIKKLNENLADNIYGYFLTVECIDDEFVKYIYWNKFFPIDALKKYYFGRGKNKNSWRKIITSLSTKIRCSSCNNNFQADVLRGSAKDDNYKIRSRQCPECISKEKIVKEENQKRREEKWRQERNQKQAHIEQLKYMPYSEYLQTEHWQEVRKYCLKKAGYRCQLCHSNRKLNVHHKTYEHRGEEDQGWNWKNDLIVLCQSCHEKFHAKLATT